MHIIALVLSICTVSYMHSQQTDAIQVHIQPTQSGSQGLVATKILIAVTSNQEPLLTIAQQVSDYVSKSGQCQCVIESHDLPTKKSVIEEIYTKGYPFAIFLTQTDSDTIEARIYDALDIAMIKGKKWQRNDASLTTWALTMSNDIWYELMGNPGSFLSQIAYIKKSVNKTHHKTTSICTVNFDGSEERTWLTTSRIVIAPTWNTQSIYPIIFYSEFTNKNVRLMGVNTSGYKWPVIDIEGTNVSIACSPTTKDVIYCHSGDIWQCVYDAAERKTKHKLLIHHEHPSAFPSYLSNGDILYCCAGGIKQWNIATQKSFTVIHDGYCIAPTYNALRNKIAYSKRVNGSMQLFVFDLTTNTHKQYTFDKGDKIDPSWSPCGTYIVYCLDKPNSSEIQVLNTLNKKNYRVSPRESTCVCPSWSPVFSRR